MKILTIIGARPQFIKAGSLSREVLRQKAQGVNISEIIVHTGQHYDASMSDIFFEQMHIPKPDYFLGIGGKSHGAMTGQMIEKIEEILIAEKPEWVVVFGDTNSTLAGAIAASKLHIKIAHIEAGLRSFNMKMPEEINRILTDRISTLLFCPTEQAVRNLLEEGYSKFKCSLVNAGDIMFDGAIYYKQFEKKPEINIPANFALSTIHRAENTDNEVKLRGIFNALAKISASKPVVMPLHPRTVGKIKKYSIETGKIKIIDPVGYLEMLWLISHSDLILTDSGGLQKEAFFFQKPCITLREETEWVELVECGANMLVGAETTVILDAFNHLSQNIEVDSFEKQQLYGDGNSAKIIIENMLKYTEENGEK